MWAVSDSIQVGDIVRIKNDPSEERHEVIAYNGYWCVEKVQGDFCESWYEASELVLISRPKSIQSGASEVNS